ncbi:hypothetical protein SAMN05421504_103643 [Amycolatopsis xylanica]|uniref:Uncharacterized protein n=1 Tax=Amycolatopsis xylanica TaxID=589385 RepID=A0A1H3E4L5_9PSEU|nr:hypothetical protein [Amycolatopsis xylanica]SDX73198.1 hypothetical protein SAMN05421504_103643 [Amycolatopsis xylanica]
MTDLVTVERGEPNSVELTRRQVRLAVEALALVETDVPLVSIVRVGVEVAVVRGLWGRLRQAVREYDEAPRARRMTIALSDVELHVVHAALVLAPRIVASEEAFHIRTGAFKEQMSSLADGLIAGAHAAEVG